MAILLIRFYQIYVSQIFGPKCRFHPTCSNYALDCFRELTFFKALWYSTLRILKCHPFHPGGYDPLGGIDKKCAHDGSH